MRSFLVSLAVVIAFVVTGGLTFIYSGFFDVAARDPHWPITRWVFETTRNRSIETRAAGISAPSGFDEPGKILIGTEHFAAHCAVCHGAPGVPKGDIARGLHPQPPDLTKTVPLYSPAELFWIVKHGIKMTGMPAWNDHRDEELSATVAFLRKLPGMTPDEYAKLVMASMAQQNQHHHDSEAPQLQDHNVRPQ
jgi:mono/diheme cytochrome c family protein